MVIASVLLRAALRRCATGPTAGPGALRPVLRPRAGLRLMANLIVQADLEQPKPAVRPRLCLSQRL